MAGVTAQELDPSLRALIGGARILTFPNIPLTAHPLSGVSTPYKSLCNDDARYIYFVKTGQSVISRFDTVSETWSDLPTVINPAFGTTSSAIVFNNGKLYFLHGQGGTQLSSYNLATNVVTLLAATPQAQAVGSCLVTDNADYVYVHLGSTDNIRRYSISGNSWAAMAASYTMGNGANMVYDDGTIYIHTGGASAGHILMYSIGYNVSTSLSTINMINGLAILPGTGQMFKAGNRFIQRYLSGSDAVALDKVTSAIYQRKNVLPAIGGVNDECFTGFSDGRLYEMTDITGITWLKNRGIITE